MSASGPSGPLVYSLILFISLLLLLLSHKFSPQLMAIMYFVKTLYYDWVINFITTNEWCPKLG